MTFARETCSSATRAFSSASRRSFSSASAAAAPAARTSPGSSSSAASWTIAATGTASRSISVTARERDVAGGRSTGWPCWST